MKRVMAGAIALAVGLAGGSARSSAQDVVGVTAVESLKEASLILDLGDGNSLVIALKNGRVLIGGHEVAAYSTGGPFERQWRDLVQAAGDADVGQLAERLRAFDMRGASDEEVGSFETLRGTLGGLAVAEAMFPSLIDVPAPEAQGADATPTRSATPAVRVHVPDVVFTETSTSFVGGLVGGAMNLLAVYVALAFMGLGFLFLAPRQLETVADTVWHSFGRSFLAGLFAQPLVLPAFAALLVGLALTVVGIVVIPFAVSAFIVALILAIVGGYIAVARTIGEIYLRRKMARGEAVASWGSYRYVLYGLLGLLAIWAPAVLLGWVPAAGTILTVSAGFATWVLATAGFGAAIISRGGVRGTFVRRLDLALTDEQYWTDEHMPTPIPRERLPRHRS
jgi:hypothetical protein